MGRPPLPSAGINRFRFRGLAASRPSQPLDGGTPSDRARV
ncbi:Hypothetical protein AA314_06231 [Archangium gephyra]|uniref:Uncharacterized protein n=1 Tax=Archangium gephyra TaxID=48 RepID=A0AAC8TG90_9BACT|nr:Hypothetical protein AA314_06231 [Archangium gephyra]